MLRARAFFTSSVASSVVLLAAALALAAAACAPAPAPPTPSPAEDSDPSDAADPAALSGTAWVEATLERLTLRQKIGQMIMPWMTGEYLAVDSDEYHRIRRWVVDQEIGGVIVSVGAPLEIAAKLNLMQELADIPLLVSADMEHGAGQRLDGGTIEPYGFEVGSGTSFPPAMGLGATGDPDRARDLGRVTALEARAAGVHMIFAPVADVNNNPDNPIINTRSYGEDPSRVAEMVAAHVRGLQEHGALATAKHFPGHGDTGTDSHIELPIITADPARVNSLELVPFRAAIDAGAAAVMSAHIAFPGLTGDSVPATLSPGLLDGMLREELGFEGIIVSDALNMGAIVRGYGHGPAAVLAIRAGADILLMPPDIESVLDTVEAAVESGELSEARIDASVRRLLAAKADLGLPERKTVDLAEFPSVVGIPVHLEVAERAAERSITLARDSRRLLPLTAPGRVLSIVYSDVAGVAAGEVLQRELAGSLPGLRTASIDDRTSSEDLDSLLARADSADLVLFSPFVRVRAWQGNLAIGEDAAALVDALIDRQVPLVLTAFGNPYTLRQFPDLGTYVLAWGQSSAAQAAAARALTGENPITGRLPISIPPLLPIGAGSDLASVPTRIGVARRDLLGPDGDEDRPAARQPSGLSAEAGGEAAAAAAAVGMDPTALARVDSIIVAAIARGLTPGAAIAVGRRGTLVRLRGYGRTDHTPGAPAATDRTVWDLASLSKVIGTTTAAMRLVDAGLLDLDQPVHSYLPEWPDSGPKAAITTRHLLTHTSGLPAWAPLFRQQRGREAYLEAIVDLPLEQPPGVEVEYSDFGVITLALIVERLAGTALDLFLARHYFDPLGMEDTGYSPLQLAGDDPFAAASGVAAADRAELATPLEDPATPAIPADLLARIAPTEVDTTFRNTHVHGVVHDENAFALGGVAGHAGLFSTARDMAVFAQMLLDGGEFGGVRFLAPGTLDRFTERQRPESSRALGWDTPAGRSSAGDYFTGESFGHTGFTGTSIWIDPEREVFVVLLTNRVNPTRDNPGMFGLRRAVHDAVQQAITDVPVTPREDTEADRASGGSP